LSTIILRKRPTNVTLTGNSLLETAVRFLWEQELITSETYTTEPITSENYTAISANPKTWTGLTSNKTWTPVSITSETWYENNPPPYGY